MRQEGKFKVSLNYTRSSRAAPGTEGDPVWEEGWGHIFKSLTVGF